MKKRSFIISTALLLAPSLAFAQNINDLMQIVIDILGGTMSVLFAVCLATFFYGIALFIWNTEDETKRELGKTWMFWSVVAMFVLITVWGLIGFLVRTFRVTPLLLPPLG